MAAFPQLNGFRGRDGLVRLVGHRGARGVMPENTIEGFASTLAMDVEALEFDVVLTADDVPVITHNHHLANSATRDAHGSWLSGPELKVASLTLEELQRFDVGGLDGRTVYGQRFPDQAFLSGIKVPRLSELLDLACLPEHRNLSLLLELKSDPDAQNDTAARSKVVRAVVAEVRGRDLTERTILHSFDWELLDECRLQAPEMPTSYLSQRPENSDDPGEDSSKAVGPDYAALTVSVPQAVADAGGQMWCPYFSDVTPDLVAEAKALGLPVSAWTVNEPKDIHNMIDAGVDGIVTDYPGRVQRILLDRGLRWK